MSRLCQLIRCTISIASVGLALAALLTLMLISVEEIYTVVIGGLLSSTRLGTVLLAAVLSAALIPFGYMVVHVCLLGRIMAKTLGSYVYRLFR
jgi:hypothetical protein